jgi:hypothetical protein
LKTLLVAVVVALIYTVLLTAAIGIVLMIFNIELGAQRWGFTIPIVVFLSLLWPSAKYAGRYVAGLDEARKKGL